MTTCEKFIEEAKLAAKTNREDRTKEYEELMRVKEERAIEHYLTIFPQFKVEPEPDKYGKRIFDICGYKFKVSPWPSFGKIEELEGLYYVFDSGPSVHDVKSFGEYVLWYEEKQRFEMERLNAKRTEKEKEYSWWRQLFN